MQLPGAIMQLPRTIEEWKRLPELRPGRYKVTDVGGMRQTIANCRASGVQDLLPLQPDEARLDAHLPNITIQEDGEQRVYRLGLDFGPIVKAIFDEACELLACGRSLLPAYYKLGIDSNGAFAIRDDASGSPRNMLLN
jgi:hypothetical protein